MKQNTLIRSDKPHAVNMPAGSNVAQRKSPPKASVPEQPPEAAPNIQKVVTTKSPKVPGISAPTPAAKTVRVKATRISSVEAPPKKTKARNTSPKSSVKTPAPTPAEPIWEQDNPVKARIEQLRTRNAQLAEQLQRLQKTPTARGKRP